MPHWPAFGGEPGHGPLRQRDGVTCGPTVAIVGAALLDSRYATQLHDPEWFIREQGRVHREVNVLWPRALGTTPAAMAVAFSRHSAVPYRWRLTLGRRDGLHDVREALLLGYPVALVVGRIVPRHWVLLIGVDADARFQCYEPSSGELRTISASDIRLGQLDR
ncbi:MAG TPA: hypothetical protein VFW21_01280, partial [Mycobacterium sp.]|nr:hypothetical protein [Mycobacterium sp.]